MKRWDVIAGLVRREGLVRGAEIGVKSGRFFSELCRLCPGVTLIGIDLWAPSDAYADWPDSHHRIHYEKAIRAADRLGGRVCLIRGDSLDAASTVEPGSLDFVFIDADHSYEGCRADIEAWLPALRPGGWMTGHDYRHPRFPGVTRAVDEAFETVAAGADHTWMTQI